MPTIQRRTLVATGLGLAAGGLVAAPRASAAQKFTYRLGDDLPVTHPLNIELRQAAANIAARSKGRLTILLFPNNQLGGDTDMLAQIRSGAVEMLTMSGNILSTMLPVESIYNLPFAFPDYAHVWAAMDGGLGDYLRAQLSTVGFHALDKHWDNGFRQITSSEKRVNAPADLRGFKIRVPPSPLWLSLFRAFGAAPTPINWSETYTALQTHIVDGQENPLVVIETGKLYEVQKYAALTNHMWDGFFLLLNKPAWEKLPPDLQEILAEEMNAAALRQRQAMVVMNNSLQAKLTGQGMLFNTPDRAAFRRALVSAGFYTEWKKKFGPTAWALLEKYSSPLA